MDAGEAAIEKARTAEMRLSPAPFVVLLAHIGPLRDHIQL
jgi:hypothetical protein